jgi:hypothetical protein
MGVSRLPFVPVLKDVIANTTDPELKRKAAPFANKCQARVSDCFGPTDQIKQR